VDLQREFECESENKIRANVFHSRSHTHSDFVAPPGIEPGSEVPETSILSIELGSQKNSLSDFHSILPKAIEGA
jgi:hypothetical protein